MDGDEVEGRRRESDSVNVGEGKGPG